MVSLVSRVSRSTRKSCQSLDCSEVGKFRNWVDHCSIAELFHYRTVMVIILSILVLELYSYFSILRCNWAPNNVKKNCVYDQKSSNHKLLDLDVAFLSIGINTRLFTVTCQTAHGSSILSLLFNKIDKNGHSIIYIALQKRTDYSEA